jgi:hypothetical protein
VCSFQHASGILYNRPTRRPSTSRHESHRSLKEKSTQKFVVTSDLHRTVHDKGEARSHGHTPTISRRIYRLHAMICWGKHLNQTTEVATVAVYDISFVYIQTHLAKSCEVSNYFQKNAPTDFENMNFATHFACRSKAADVPTECMCRP